jgi:DDE superfamily endonuclease
MQYETFCNLCDKLEPAIRQMSRKKGTDPLVMRRAPNGLIEPSARLGCFLRFAAGGSVYDIMLAFGIGRADVSKSIWIVVDAINQCSDLDLIYPTCHVEQRRIVDEFKAKLFAGFDRCAGALDGILIWTQRPSEEDAKLSGCVVAKFFCGRKHKYGLNCQAICDARSKFLDVSVMFPGSTSDVLSFESASIFKRLENGLLAPGVYIVHRLFLFSLSY